MFSINIYLRFALIGICFVGGILLSIIYGFWYAFPFLLTAIILAVGYFLMGTVMSAGEMLQAQDFEGAEKRLDLTLKPNWLYKTNRAFFYLMKGTLAMQNKDTNTAEAFLKKAKEIELPSDNEKAMVELQLANIYVQKNNWAVVKKHIQVAKKLNITEPQITAQLAQFEAGLKQQGQMNMARQMNKGRMPTGGSGKRRRPKMR